MVRTGEPSQVVDRIDAADHVVVINILQIAAGLLFCLRRARAAAHGPALIKSAQMIREETATVQYAQLEIGKAIENSAVGHEAQRKSTVCGIAADEPQTVGRHLFRAGHVFRMHDDQGVQFLCLCPERIEIGAVIVVAVDVGADVAAAQLEIAHRVLEDSGGADSVLQWHGSDSDETVRVAGDQLSDSFIVDATPTLALFAGETVTQGRRMSFQSSDSQLVLLHHLESLVDGGELTLEHELWTAGERQGLLPVGLRELYPKRFAVIFSFFQEAVRHVVMMNIDTAD